LRTRLSICRKKQRFITEAEALIAASQAPFPLRSYRCDRCRWFHLTSRLNGKRIERPVAGIAPIATLPSFRLS